MIESASLGGLKRNLWGGTNDAPGLVPDRFQDEKKCIDENLTVLGPTRPNDPFRNGSEKKPAFARKSQNSLPHSQWAVLICVMMRYGFLVMSVPIYIIHMYIERWYRYGGGGGFVPYIPYIPVHHMQREKIAILIPTQDGIIITLPC